MMKFASAFSIASDCQNALHEACQAVVEQIGGPIDIAFVFFSSEYLRRAEENNPGSANKASSQLASRLAEELVKILGTENVIGCSCESVIANQYELEWQAAVSVFAANLDGTQVDVCHLNYLNRGPDAAFDGWPDSMLGSWQDGSTIFLFADPFSFPVDLLLEHLNEDRTGVPVVGGMSSGAAGPGQARLLLGRQAFDRGAVLLRVSGQVSIETVVSQGCRPIGKPLVITRCERNEIFELAGLSAVEQLQRIFRTLPVREQKMVNQGLFVGRVVSEYLDHPVQGDFLVRNVTQIDEQSGTIAISDYVRAGQTIQFQIRDEDTADVELNQLLARANADPDKEISAALIFSCNGRGSNLFTTEHHDAAMVQKAFGKIPAAGFFAAGEIGPVTGKNFLHSLTTSIALFR